MITELEIELQKKQSEVKAIQKQILIEKFKQDFRKTKAIFIDVVTPERDYQVEVEEKDFAEILKFILEKDIKCHSDRHQNTKE